MESQRRIILYGNSIILGTVGASLARYPDLEIIALSPPLPGADALAMLVPDVILFDMEAARPEPAFALLKSQPHLLLVGVNPESAEVTLWSSMQGRAMTAEDLVKLISREVEL